MCYKIRCDGESKIFCKILKTKQDLTLKTKKNQDSLSHQILRHIYRAINIDENKI